MNKSRIAQYVAIGATLFLVIGGLLRINVSPMVGMYLLGIGFIAELVAYILAEGFSAAAEIVGSIVKRGWKLIPWFPACLFSFLFALILAVIIVVFFPIIPVRKAYKNNESI